MTAVDGGDALNVIPSIVKMKGTIRASNPTLLLNSDVG